MFHPKYRADIDGLRAIAILLVVIFHAFPGLLKGGFIGVDIFFVISGYLISNIIIKSLEDRSFSLRQFYANRIRRIFPALLVVLGTTWLAGWFALLDDEYKQLGEHIFGGAFFLSNLLQWRESGYFDSAANTKPLLHLWSLGIEEQFYIFWPLLLGFAHKWGLNPRRMALLIGICSFTLNLQQVNSDPIGAFYSPLTRIWEFLAGSLFAWIPPTHKTNPRTINATPGLLDFLQRFFTPGGLVGPLVREGSAIAGMGLLIFGLFIVREDLDYPGAWALIPVLGSMLIISAGRDSWINRSVLSNRLMVGFGLISYPLYLWHWPLLSFARMIEGKMPERVTCALIVILSILLAWLTYRFIEQPLRKQEFRTPLQSKVALTVMMALGGLGYLTYVLNGFPSRVDAFKAISQAAGEWEYPGQMHKEIVQGRAIYSEKSAADQITLFAGDSTIEQYYPRADVLIKENPGKYNGIVFVTRGGCLPVPKSPYDGKRKDCNGLMETAFTLAQDQIHVRNVVIGGQWIAYLGDGFGLNVPFGHDSSAYKAAIGRLSRYIQQLSALRKRVFLVLNTPIGYELDPKHLAQRKLLNFPDLFMIQSGGMRRDLLEAKYAKINHDLKALSIAEGATIIDPIPSLCDARFCPSTDKQGLPMYKDETHLRPQYVRAHATFMDITLEAARD